MNRTSIRRALVPGVAVVALAAGLSACGAGNEAVAAATPASPAPSTVRVPPPRRPPRPPGAPASRAPTPTSPSTTTRSAPAAAASSSSPAASTSPAPTPTSTTTRRHELTDAKERCGGEDPIEVPVYVSPIAVVYNLEGVDELNLSPDTIGEIFAGKITTWNDAAIAADNPDATLPRRDDHARCTARTSRAPRRTSPTTSSKAADGGWTVRPRTRPGRSRAARPPRAPPASSPAVKSGDGHDRLRRREPGRRPRQAPTSRSGDEYVAPTAEAAAKVVDDLARASRAAPTTTSPSTSTAPPPRRAPTRSSWCRT